ncbi:GNAT family N-acetyltransferase [Streptomyces sp. NPDC018693]|uniref:GNAT family N-acetyltransferase n=1 Tax=unclassified Streptomyces TaxID=2593676 RepID=UPI0037B37788
MSAPRWHLTEDLTEFLDRAGDFLRSRPALHTVPLTVTEDLRSQGTRRYGEQAPFFGYLRGDRAQVRAACFRTPPFGLYVTPLTADDADSLARRLTEAGRDLPGVAGDRETAEGFARAWRRRTGAPFGLHQHQRLYRLGDLTPPSPAPPGRARTATEADRPQLRAWHDDFIAAIGEPPRDDADAWIDARLSRDGLTLWEGPEGIPVAMAGVTSMVAGQIRVAPVYTPAQWRGRGYAGAATAEASRAALAAGASEVLLFTDLANPTSNGLYQRLGYRPVRDFAVYDFG